MNFCKNLFRVCGKLLLYITIFYTICKERTSIVSMLVGKNFKCLSAVRLTSRFGIIHCDHVWRQFRAGSLSTVDSRSELLCRQTSKPKNRLRSRLLNLINKRAPGDPLLRPNTPHIRHFRGMIRGPWKWRDWIGRGHVFNKTRRARDRKSRRAGSKPWRDQLD